MAGVRRALIVATDEYTDPKLTSLHAPAKDARALAEVLHDDAVGCFEVETVLNRPCHEVEIAVAEFFSAGRFGDTLLAHFSCHGVKSPSGELYFATTDTDLSDPFKLKVTGIPSALVRDAMEESRASLILCLVDCCYSGAFVKLAKAADTVDLTERLGGKGRAVITASTSLQLALDGKEEPSLFTRAVIDGLRTGEADRDLDGLVSLDELYSFVHEQVTSRNPNQTPVKSFDVQGEVYVARRGTPVTRPASLDPALLADARDLVTYKRQGAVRGLADVLAEGHPGRSLAARLELTRMAGGDDSLSVRSEAQKVLDRAGALPTPAIPDYEPQVVTRGGPPPAVDASFTDTSPTDVTTTTGTTTAGPTTTDPTTTDPTTTETTATGAIGGGDGGGHGSVGEGRRWYSIGRKRAGVIAIGLVGVLMVGGLAWKAVDDGGGTGTGGVSEPVLPETALLLTLSDPQQGTGIFAVDVEGKDRAKIINGPEAGLPTISEDRKWIAYVATRSEAHGGIPHLARVDGSDDARLLDTDATQTCPLTSRPAFSPDGGFLAVICLDANSDTLGLEIVDRDGHLVRVLSKNGDIRGAPTYTGNNSVVFMRDVDGNGTTTLWEVSDQGGKPVPVTDGLDGSDSHPDWSNLGLLFVRTRDDGSRDVYYMETLDARGVTPISSSGVAESATWSPDDESAVAWLEPEPEGPRKTLWAKALSDGSPTKIGTGDYGPPAWGSR